MLINLWHVVKRTNAPLIPQHCYFRKLPRVILSIVMIARMDICSAIMVARGRTKLDRPDRPPQTDHTLLVRVVSSVV